MEFFDSLSFKALKIWRLLVYAMVRVRVRVTVLTYILRDLFCFIQSWPCRIPAFQHRNHRPLLHLHSHYRWVMKILFHTKNLLVFSYKVLIWLWSGMSLTSPTMLSTIRLLLLLVLVRFYKQYFIQTPTSSRISNPQRLYLQEWSVPF